MRTILIYVFGLTLAYAVATRVSAQFEDAVEGYAQTMKGTTHEIGGR